jgi:uncharacterized protein YkwD
MRLRSSTCCLGLFIGPLFMLLAAPVPVHAGTFEDAVLAELNRVRAHPQAYARELNREQVTPSRYDEQTADVEPDDPAAVEDAIDFLMRQSPLPPLASDERLAAAADAHAVSQGPTGQVGHGPPGSLATRLQRQGLYAGVEAESISYGQNTPRDVVRQLIVDSGVPNRAHRKDLLGRGFQAAGVGCGRHAEWGSMCVIDLAGAIVRR